MANTPKLIIIPGTFEDAVAGLLNTPPPPKGPKGKPRPRASKRAKPGRKKAR